MATISPVSVVAPPGLVSILVPCCGMLEYTKLCLLLRRSVLQRVGPGLNEWTDLSLFDTDILSAKAHQAGFTLTVCRDLFIHHFGTRTFAHGAPQQAGDPGNGRQARPTSTS